MPTLPKPVPGLVIRYDYLWLREHHAQRISGAKSRPCVVVVATVVENKRLRVMVAPITHRRPERPDQAVAIPAKVKQRLNLDAEASWIMASEMNRFFWPGPDLRTIAVGRFDYGFLPQEVFDELRAKLRTSVRRDRLGIVPRGQ